MEHTASGGHSARRNDNGGHPRLSQLLGLGSRRDRTESLGAEHTELALVAGMALTVLPRVVVIGWPVRRLLVARLRLHFGIELPQPLGVTGESVHRHGTVEEHWQHGNPLFLFEPLQPVNELL